MVNVLFTNVARDGRSIPSFERSAIWQAGINHESGQKLPGIFRWRWHWVDSWAVARLSMPEFRDFRSWTPHTRTLPIPISSLDAKVMIGQAQLTRLSMPDRFSCCEFGKQWCPGAELNNRHADFQFSDYPIPDFPSPQLIAELIDLTAFARPAASSYDGQVPYK